MKSLTLYEAYIDNKISQREFEFAHKVCDEEHTLTASYETDAKSVREIRDIMWKKGKGNTQTYKTLGSF